MPLPAPQTHLDLRPHILTQLQFAIPSSAGKVNLLHLFTVPNQKQPVSHVLKGGQFSK